MSIYLSEELLSYDEILRDWIVNKSFLYDSRDVDHQEIYKKLNIPFKKYLISFICNNFNKMIFEDGYKEPLLKEINQKASFISSSEKISDIRFICEDYRRMEVEGLQNEIKTYSEKEAIDKYNKNIDKIRKKFNIGTDIAPPIYTTTSLLNTIDKNTFNHERTNIDDLNGLLSPTPLLKIEVQNSEYYKLFYMHVPDIKYAYIDDDYKDKILKDWTSVVQFLIVKGVISYNTDPVGWKKADGIPNGIV